MNYFSPYRVLKVLQDTHPHSAQEDITWISLQESFTGISRLFDVKFKWTKFSFVFNCKNMNHVSRRVLVMFTNNAYCRLVDTRCVSSISVILYFELFLSDTVMSHMTLAVHHWFKMYIFNFTFVSLSHYSFMLCALSF